MNANSLLMMSGGGNRHPDCYSLTSFSTTSQVAVARWAVDKDGNIGVISQLSGTDSAVRITKFGPTGAKVFDRRNYMTGEDWHIDGSEGDIAFDQDGNMWAMSWHYASTMTIQKISATGSQVWRGNMRVDGVPYIRKLIVDSAGSVYVSGTVSSYEAGLIKINPGLLASNTAGVGSVWSFGHNWTNASDANQDAITDMVLSAAEDFVYFSGHVTDTAPNSYPTVGKASASTGAYTIYRLGVFASSAGIARHGSDIFVLLTSGMLIKFDANLNIAWSKTYTGLTSFSRLSADGYGNLYAVTGNKFLKIEAGTGTALFQGAFTQSSGSTLNLTDEVAFNQDGTIHLVGLSGQNMFVAKLPPEGIALNTGVTYGDITYTVTAAPATVAATNPSRTLFVPAAHAVGENFITESVNFVTWTSTDTVTPIPT